MLVLPTRGSMNHHRNVKIYLSVRYANAPAEPKESLPLDHWPYYLHVTTRQSLPIRFADHKREGFFILDAVDDPIMFLFQFSPMRINIHVEFDLVDPSQQWTEPNITSHHVVIPINGPLAPLHAQFCEVSRRVEIEAWANFNSYRSNDVQLPASMMHEHKRPRASAPSAPPAPPTSSQSTPFQLTTSSTENALASSCATAILTFRKDMPVPTYPSADFTQPPEPEPDYGDRYVRTHSSQYKIKKINLKLKELGHDQPLNEDTTEWHVILATLYYIYGEYFHIQHFLTFYTAFKIYKQYLANRNMSIPTFDLKFCKYNYRPQRFYSLEHYEPNLEGEQFMKCVHNTNIREVCSSCLELMEDIILGLNPLTTDDTSRRIAMCDLSAPDQVIPQKHYLPENWPRKIALMPSETDHRAAGVQFPPLPRLPIGHFPFKRETMHTRHRYIDVIGGMEYPKQADMQYTPSTSPNVILRAMYRTTQQDYRPTPDETPPPSVFRSDQPPPPSTPTDNPNLRLLQVTCHSHSLPSSSTPLPEKFQNVIDST